MDRVTPIEPILLIGATGLIGSRVAHILRNRHPKAYLALVGRDIEASKALANKLGHAEAQQIDLQQRNLGIDPNKNFAAVALFMKDDSLNSLRFAQGRQIPYMDISSAAFEIGPEVTQFIQAPKASAVLMNSNWLAGTSTNVVVHLQKSFRTVTSITISALLDSEDIGGKAASVDYDRQTGATESALVLQDGQWRWLNAQNVTGSFVDSGGTTHSSQAFSNMDVLSVAASTGAKNVRFEFAVGETPARAAGNHFSHEIIITLTGQKRSGTNGTFRYEIIHPKGQAPMTALSAALGIETLLGLNKTGKPVAPGLYMPHTIIDSDDAVHQLRSIGTVIKEV
jgi:hypothetical protein